MKQYKCPRCYSQIDEVIVEEDGKQRKKRKQIWYPWFDNDRNPVWKNIFHIDWFVVAITISILLIIIGAKQTMGNCKDLLEDPCSKLTSVCCVPDGGGYDSSSVVRSSLGEGEEEDIGEIRSYPGAEEDIEISP